jgi:hypothetical protein
VNIDDGDMVTMNLHYFAAMPTLELWRCVKERFIGYFVRFPPIDRRDSPVMSGGEVR